MNSGEPTTSAIDDVTALDDATFMQAYLANRDEPCPVCGYNLRQLQNDSCPECGRALRLRVGSVEPRLVWFLVTLVPWCLLTGMGVLFAIIVAKEGMPRHLDMGGQYHIILNLIVMPVPLLLLPLRRLFCKQANTVKMACAAVTWLFTLFMFAWLLVWID